MGKDHSCGSVKVYTMVSGLMIKFMEKGFLNRLRVVGTRDHLKMVNEMVLEFKQTKKEKFLKEYGSMESYKIKSENI